MKYLVKHSLFGAWPRDSVFSEESFRKRFPLPKTDATDRQGLTDDPAYWQGLIDRALAIGAIVKADNDAVETDIPLGPENTVQSLSKDSPAVVDGENQKRGPGRPRKEELATA